MRLARTLPTLLSILALVAAVASSCSPGDSGKGSREGARQTGRPRVFLLAADGLEWDVLLPLVRQGRTPELRRLMEDGVFGSLETLTPTMSPAIWSTVATGKSPETHGVPDFAWRDPQDPDRWHLYTSADLRSRTLWSIASEAGLRVGVVGWFLTYPVEPVSGVMVAQANTLVREGVEASSEEMNRRMKKGRLLRDVEGQVYPPERHAEMMDRLAAVDERLPHLLEEVFGKPPHPPGSFEKQIWKASRWALRSDATYVDIALALAAEKDAYDLLALYLGGTDVLSHRFWRYLHPELFDDPPPSEQVENFADMIPSYYAYVDRVLGEVRRAFPGPLTVVVLSDHGIHPVSTEGRFGPRKNGGTYLSGGHHEAPPGVFLAAGPGIREGADPGGIPSSRAEIPVIGTVLDVTPTLLTLFGLPVGEDMEGRVLEPVLSPAPEGRTPPAAVPTWETEAWLASRSPAEVIEEPDEEARLEQLRSLGYIQ